jgi:glycosyltransferase involved in cell wall biosynthesis
LGKIPNSELPYFLQIGDFYAFTSLWKEGFGLSLAEAAKCGNRILAANSGGIPEVIANLPGALLVEHPNILEEWEEALEIAWNERDDFFPDKELLYGFQSLENWEKRYLKALGS